MSVSAESNLYISSDGGTEFVCADCIDDEGIKDFISRNAESEECSFCGAKGKDPVAAPMEDVIDHMRNCLGEFYDDPVNCLPWESAEGGYLGETFSTDELIGDKLQLGFPRDRDGRLFETICEGMGDQLWCDANPFSLNHEELLRFSWDRFCEAVKHKRRFFFLESKKRRERHYDPEELYDPGEILRMIFSFAENAGLFIPLKAGATLFRVRHQAPGHIYKTTLELGPPPVEKSVQNNRMSPPGIVMMYASEDEDTALAETAIMVGDYAIGTFTTHRDALLLDLTRLPSVPTIFQELPDTLEYNPRPQGIFLRHISREISRPIARDDRVHVEYVPTQVVTEYLRTVTTVDGRPIEGVRYNSSRPNAQTSLVLFADQSNLILPESEQPEFYHFSKDRWLKLVDSKVRALTTKHLKKWT